MRFAKFLFPVVCVFVIVFGFLVVYPLSSGAIAAPTAKTIYVDADATSGANNGSSWTDAYTKLQDALGDPSLASGDQIWVAEGVYYPDEGDGQVNDSRDSTFTLKAGVNIFGGFAGDETVLSQRDWETNVTVLSGDIDGNDVTNGDGVVTSTAHIFGANSYHVVVNTGLSSSTILNGFFITAGYADDSYNSGGGMVNINSSPWLINLVFSGNYAGFRGGGLYNDDSSPFLVDVTFTDNYAISGGGLFNRYGSNPFLGLVTFNRNAASYAGGGIFNATNSSPTLDGVTFTDNSAASRGGGMVTADGDPTLSNVTFTGNSAENGGGMYNMSNSSPTLTDVSFTNNSADYGGGMHNQDNSSPTLTDAAFSENTAAVYGGGMYNTSGSNPSLMDVTFSENSANYGGGMLNEGSSPILTNVTFLGNSAAFNGGGMNNYLGSNPGMTNVIFSGNSADHGGAVYNSSSNSVLINVTISGNLAGIYGGGIFNTNSDPTIINTIIWWNNAVTSGDQLYNSSSTPSINYSDIQGCGASITWHPPCGNDGGFNIDNNPLFVRDPDPGPDDTWDGVDDDYGDLHLQSDSPVIDRGAGKACPATDLDGTPRPYGSACDMGAYEFWRLELFLPVVVR